MKILAWLCRFNHMLYLYGILHQFLKCVIIHVLYNGVVLEKDNWHKQIRLTFVLTLLLDNL